MADTNAQSSENHTRIVPAYHVVTLGILAINLLWSLSHVVKYPGVTSGMAFLVAVALVLLALYARAFAQEKKVYDDNNENTLQKEIVDFMTECWKVDHQPALEPGAESRLNAGEIRQRQGRGEDHLPARLHHVIEQDKELIAACVENSRDEYADKVHQVHRTQHAPFLICRGANLDEYLQRHGEQPGEDSQNA
jgi:hypothetical protein